MAKAPIYTPAPVPGNTEDLPQYIFEELTKLQGALKENPVAYISVKNAAPIRIKQGDIVYGDGTNFNPGAGEGVYFRNAAGSWVKLG